MRNKRVTLTRQDIDLIIWAVEAMYKQTTYSSGSYPGLQRVNQIKEKLGVQDAS